MSGIGGTTKRDTEIRLPRATKVKNKQPAAQQVRAFKLSAGSQPPRLRWDAARLHQCRPGRLAEWRLLARSAMHSLSRHFQCV